jgi:hypothetical protein
MWAHDGDRGQAMFERRWSWVLDWQKCTHVHYCYSTVQVTYNTWGLTLPNTNLTSATIPLDMRPSYLWEKLWVCSYSSRPCCAPNLIEILAVTRWLKFCIGWYNPWRTNCAELQSSSTLYTVQRQPVDFLLLYTCTGKLLCSSGVHFLWELALTSSNFLMTLSQI